MAEGIEIRIPWDAARTSPNRLNRLLWPARLRITHAAKEAAMIAWRLAGSPVLGVPVVVDWTIRRARLLDDDGAAASLKALRDSLFVGRITPDDSPRWVGTGAVRQETGKRYRGREEVVVRVRPREAP